MKSVLISIQPKWCKLIASGKKTVEVRKTKPKINEPFKCYIYCTKGEHLWKTKNIMFLDRAYNRLIDDLPDYLLNGKIIGEFVCDRIVEFENSLFDEALRETVERSCVPMYDLFVYLGKQDYGYGWHITDLVIYDEPKELKDFQHTDEYISKRRSEVTHWEYGIDDEIAAKIRRPPQSWCYVTKIGGK